MEWFTGVMLWLLLLTHTNNGSYNRCDKRKSSKHNILVINLCLYTRCWHIKAIHIQLYTNTHKYIIDADLFQIHTSISLMLIYSKYTQVYHWCWFVPNTHKYIIDADLFQIHTSISLMLIYSKYTQVYHWCWFVPNTHKYIIDADLFQIHTSISLMLIYFKYTQVYHWCWWDLLKACSNTIHLFCTMGRPWTIMTGQCQLQSLMQSMRQWVNNDGTISITKPDAIYETMPE